MKTLTKAQELKQEEKRLALIEKNAPMLFDIENAIALGKEFRAELDELNKANDEIVAAQRERCLEDFSKLQAFLGIHKDLVILYDIEISQRDGYFGFVIGDKAINKDAIFVNYYFLREWWEDADNFKRINNKNYPTYYKEGLEVWSEGVGETETFYSLEDMFNDNDYVRIIEELLTQYIITK